MCELKMKVIFSYMIIIGIINSWTSVCEAITCHENPIFDCLGANTTECSGPKFIFGMPVVRQGYPAATMEISDEPNVCFNMTDTNRWDNGVRTVIRMGFFVTGPTTAYDNVCRRKDLNLTGKVANYKFCTCIQDNCNGASGNNRLTNFFVPTTLGLLYFFTYTF